MSRPIAYARVPEHQRGWDGHWGIVPVQGPDTAPEGYEPPPDPAKVVDAEVITSWACHTCKAENDVWGEGAVYSWMECSECGEFSYLVM